MQYIIVLATILHLITFFPNPSNYIEYMLIWALKQKQNKKPWCQLFMSISNQDLIYDFMHVKMLNSNLNYMGVIFVFVSTTFEDKKLFILSYLPFPKTPRWPLKVKYVTVYWKL